MSLAPESNLAPTILLYRADSSDVTECGVKLKCVAKCVAKTLCCINMYNFHWQSVPFGNDPWKKGVVKTVYRWLVVQELHDLVLVIGNYVS